MKNTYFYAVGQDNLYNDQGVKVYDPMEDVLTQITDPKIVLETVTNQKSYYKLKPPEKMVIDDIPKPAKAVKVVNALKTTSTYKNYSDRQND